MIYPKPYYSQLFSNRCEELIDIVTFCAKTIAHCRGLISNNKITLDNVMRCEEKSFGLYDWGCSAIKEVLRVRDRGFTKYHQPVWKEGDSWLV